MDWRYDERDGQYKIVDCNPRVGMNFRMFESSAAVDVVRAQHLDLTGRNIAPSQMVDNRVFIVESIYALSRIRGNRPAWTNDAVKKYSGSRELAWWSGDDVLPVVSVIVRLIPQTVQRALRQFWIYARTLPGKCWRRNDVGKQPALP
jgi:predicted ATP-grasp superfamily ATP-dependent carboligase